MACVATMWVLYVLLLAHVVSLLHAFLDDTVVYLVASRISIVGMLRVHGAASLDHG